MPEDPIEGQVEFNKKTWFLSIESDTHRNQGLIRAASIEGAWGQVEEKVKRKEKELGGTWRVTAFNRV